MPNPNGQSATESEPRWLTVEQIRKQQRMRRETVIQAMLSGELPYEQRGRIRYARLSDIQQWEQTRLQGVARKRVKIHPDLAEFLPRPSST